MRAGASIEKTRPGVPVFRAGSNGTIGLTESRVVASSRANRHVRPEIDLERDG
jgi:hypothetical protein